MRGHCESTQLRAWNVSLEPYAVPTRPAPNIESSEPITPNPNLCIAVASGVVRWCDGWRGGSFETRRIRRGPVPIAPSTNDAQSENGRLRCFGPRFLQLAARRPSSRHSGRDSRPRLSLLSRASRTTCARRRHGACRTARQGRELAIARLPTVRFSGRQPPRSTFAPVLRTRSCTRSPRARAPVFACTRFTCVRTVLMDPFN